MSSRHYIIYYFITTSKASIFLRFSWVFLLRLNSLHFISNVAKTWKLNARLKGFKRHLNFNTSHFPLLVYFRNISKWSIPKAFYAQHEFKWEKIDTMKTKTTLVLNVFIFLKKIVCEGDINFLSRDNLARRIRPTNAYSYQRKLQMKWILINFSTRLIEFLFLTA